MRSMADGYVCANFPRSVFLKRDGDGVGGDNNPSKYSNSSVRYFDGVVQLAWTDLRSDGFGAVCDQRRSWSNGDYNPLDSNLRPRSDNGTGMVVEQLPYLTGHIGRGPTVVVITSATSVRFYDAIFSANDWLARFYTKDQLTFTNGELVLTDTAGNQIHFYDTFGGLVNPRWGKFKSMTDPDGNITTVTGWTDDGKAAEVQRSTPVGQTPHVVESFVYSYVPSGINQGLINNVTLRRQVDGGDWNVEQACWMRPESSVRIAAVKDDQMTQPWSLLKAGTPIFTMPRAAMIRRPNAKQRENMQCWGANIFSESSLSILIS